MIIAIDFDGTIVTNKFPAIGDPIPGAAENIRYLALDGHYIIINTCRSNDDAIAAVNYLRREGIPFDAINDNHPEHIEKYGNNCRKIYAHCYIDDKQVGGLPEWDVIYAEVSLMEANYKANKNGHTSKNIR